MLHGSSALRICRLRLWPEPWRWQCWRSEATIALIAGIALPTAVPARAAAPLNYLLTHGTRAHSISILTWFTLSVSIAVIAVITALLLGGIWRARSGQAPVLPGEAAVERPHGGAAWIYVGVAATTVILFVTTVWTMVTLADTSNPPLKPPALRLQVTGHQWWWDVRYTNEDPSQEFSTANEIHIPVGKIVHLDLRGADVIHSFWVPTLAGKTDLIPGQENRTWIEADRPGIYRGQCGEYCGQQHAHMAFDVIASPDEQFEAWRRQQLKGAAEQPQGTAASAGARAFLTHCGICHTVRGTSSGGIVGPDLTHIMSRATIGAATLPNTPGRLAAWIADPQHFKPGNQMPTLDLSGPEMALILQYVQALH